MTNPFNTVGVLGAGTMGSGIAQLIAQQQFSVVLYDISPEVLNTGLAKITAFLEMSIEKGKISVEEKESTLGRITPVTDLGALSSCDLIIEAIPEVLDLKKSVFQSLDTLCPPETIFASNTSSFSITAIGGATQRPTQVAGLHFFNPAPLMKLVEVVYGQKTAPEVVDQLMDFSKRLGKTPVKVKDTPGFIVNRVARPFYGEALKILGESHGAAASLSESQTIETIDTILKEAGGFRMGPFELMDLIGIDINFAVTQSVYDATFQEPRYRPHPIQKRMVEAGLLGKKSGEGFYQYDHC